MQRLLGMLVAVVLAVLSVAAFRAGDNQTPSPAAPPVSAPPTAAVPPAVTTSDIAGGDAVAGSGPGLTEPGIHVLAQPTADGTLEVVERVRPTSPVSSLSVAPPRPAGAGTAGANPTITTLQAQADGAVVADLPRSPVTAQGAKLTLVAPAQDVVMRFRLEGGVARSQPAPVGRVLVVLGPITAADPNLAELPVVVEVVGAGVRNLVCPNLPTGEQLCGRQKGRVWSTPSLRPDRSLVVAQVDLPQPGDR